MKKETLLLTLALETGSLMLKSGAETFRVEDTMARMLAVLPQPVRPEAFVTPTGIFASLSDMEGQPITRFKRTDKGSHNLNKIVCLNALSRKFVGEELTIEEAFEELEQIKNLPSFPAWVHICAYGAGSAFFTLLFQGSISDGTGALLIGTLLGTITTFLSQKKVSVFLIHIIGGALITVGALLWGDMFPASQYERIIFGAIMPLVPGVVLTNAIRDVMEGNFLSGASQLLEAVLTAVSIASGVGMALKLFAVWQGGA